MSPERWIRLIAGVFVTVSVVLSYLQRGQLTRLLVADGQKVARVRLLMLGPRAGGRVEILSGLTPGERIVVGGAERVSEGSRVDTGG